MRIGYLLGSAFVYQTLKLCSMAEIWHTTFPPNPQHNLFAVNISCDVDGWLELTYDFLRLGLSQWIHFSSPFTICHRKVFLTCLLQRFSSRSYFFFWFSSSGTHVPSFYIFSIFTNDQVWINFILKNRCIGLPSMHRFSFLCELSREEVSASPDLEIPPFYSEQEQH